MLSIAFELKANIANFVYYGKTRISLKMQVRYRTFIIKDMDMTCAFLLRSRNMFFKMVVLEYADICCKKKYLTEKVSQLL